ncbi:endonuclease domain-containing protein [Streptomyces ipomoeae]|uniref:endonuclease domain-containing protein n=1 Tax=Streptomyces ipomoeae TaxID=103232 RepID=UPI00114793F2|nr:endonuclease domain-containing protein [Streptomyces ipomoeae]MDX2932145.1 endonuclease domain-containing protein [Streptomyces ipomoeae]TQE23351.1 recombination endonuclease VII [Streptomyces ipomoeae]
MASEDGVKRCVRCGEYKPYAAFARKRSNLDGLQRHCRDCATSYHCRAPEPPVLGPAGDVPEGHKRCRGCGEVKPHSEWNRKRDGLASRCKACRAAVRPAEHLRRKYGLTEAGRDELIAFQGGVCCICLSAPATHVDHCHNTGRVRGVLCFNCNSGLGLLRDDPAAMNRAADYLEGNAWKPTLVAPGVYQLPS